MDALMRGDCYTDMEPFPFIAWVVPDFTVYYIGLFQTQIFFLYYLMAMCIAPHTDCVSQLSLQTHQNKHLLGNVTVWLNSAMYHDVINSTKNFSVKRAYTEATNSYCILFSFLWEFCFTLKALPSCQHQKRTVLISAQG